MLHPDQPQNSSLGKSNLDQRTPGNSGSPNKLALATNHAMKGNGKRMESPDNDSAFCDNLSVLSSSNSNDALAANCSSNVPSKVII